MSTQSPSISLSFEIASSSALPAEREKRCSDRLVLRSGVDPEWRQHATQDADMRHCNRCSLYIVDLNSYFFGPGRKANAKVLRL